MNASTINGSTFTLLVNGAVVSGSVAYDASARIAAFLPSAGILAEGQSYVATITTGVTDLAGNALASNFQFSFTTVDNTPPAISSRSPAPGATNVATNTTVQVGFNEAMNASTITASTFTLSTGGSGVAGSVSYSSATRIATFTPSAALASGQSYTVTVTTGVRDVPGNALAANDVFSFTTVDNVPPTIVSRSPSPSATNVPTSTTVQIGFSEPMDASTINSGTLTLSTGGIGVPGTVTYNPATRVATFTPASALASTATYTVLVTTGVRDAGGNALASSDSYTFTTADNSPPTIVSRSPVPGATNVATSATVQVGFSEPMDASTITGSTFTVSTGGSDIAGVVSYDAGTRVATFTPAAALGSSQTYTVTVTTGVRDVAGNALSANDVFSFITIDNIAPTIVSRVPASGATDVAPGATVQVGFSEAMDASTITNLTFTVSTGGTDIAGVVTYDSGTRVATFTPSAPLLAGQTYTVTVTTGVRDVAGNALATNDVFSFATAP